MPEDDGVEKIKFSEIRRDDNMQAVRDELTAQNITFENNDNWIVLLTKLRSDEGNNSREFKPCLPYSRFKVKKRNQAQHQRTTRESNNNLATEAPTTNPVSTDSTTVVQRLSDSAAVVPRPVVVVIPPAAIVPSPP